MSTSTVSREQSSPELLASPLHRIGLLDAVRLVQAFARRRGNTAATLGDILLHERRRTIQAGIGPLSVTITCDPQVARRILSDAHDEFSKMPYERHVLDPVMAGGSILLEGAAWQKRRQSVAPAFGPVCMERLAERAASIADRRVSNWSGRVNVSHEVRCIVNEVATEFFSGLAPQALGTDVDEDARIFQATERSLEARLSDPLDLRRRVGRTMKRDPFRSFQRSKAQLQSALEQAAACPAHANDSARLFVARLNPVEATDEFATMIAAGATSGHHLSWTCDLLSRSPEAQEHARRDALGQSGPSSDEGEVRGAIDASLSEALRLYPPAPMIFRRRLSTHDYIVINVWAMHRDPDVWPEPDVFVPARWLDVRQTPEAFMPYGLGPRICIGRRYSQILAHETLAAILRRHTLRPTTERRPFAKTHIMTRPAQDIVIEVA